MRDFVPVTLPLFRNVYQDNAEAIDQLISGFVKYTFPEENAELSHYCSGTVSSLQGK